MKVIMEHYVRKGRHFTIIQNAEGFYLAIESKYITDGKLNTGLNGLQMHASTDLNECLASTDNSVDVDYYMGEGMTKAEAFAKVYNLDVNAVKVMFKED